ncbi:TonB-dependent receptor [Sphingopyxis sp. YF1]|uniref:TonB-dependent receptor n=1 Tax=Sphingopyxis sp. YF1 TaxID=2482763 RepID=UPI001F619265|nr:TonB-dependent receptor [Sphingopyxis sp. YF1]UNU44463.1 TonB-dependent receptor [Sphingopyxis sp. YF1]
MKQFAALFLLAAPAAASAHEGSAEIDVPAGSLGSAVATLSRQAQIDVGVEDPALQRYPTPRVRGRMSAPAALDLLLRATPATWKRGRGGLFHIVRRPRRVVRVRAVPPPPAPSPIAPVAEIVVTASKRGEELGCYPATVQILGGDAFGPSATVDSAGLIRRLAQLGSTEFGPGRNRLFLRGLIESSFSGPGQTTTGQYFGDIPINYNGPDPALRLPDVERVEVLEGPQGTLYGAGTLGGVIRVVPRAPRAGSFEGSLSIGLTSLSHGEAGGNVSATINVPVGENAALRVTGYGAREGGYIDIPALGRSNVNLTSVRGGRGAFGFDAGDWTVEIGALTQTIRAQGSQWTEAGAPAYIRLTPAAEPYGSGFHLSHIAVRRSVGEAELVSTLGLVRRSMRQQYDRGSATMPSAVSQRDASDLLVGETRLSRKLPGGAGWLLGLAYMESDSRTRRYDGLDSTFAALRQRATNRVGEITLFGEASVDIVARLTATAGLRVDYTQLSGDAWARANLGALPGTGKPLVARLHRRDLRAHPGLAISFAPSEGALFYVRYQEGFRPGGVGVVGLKPEVHRGDDMRSWELGHRIDLARELEFGASLSYARWNDILAEVVSRTGDLMTANIGDGSLTSLEAQLRWHPSGWRLSAGVLLTRGRLTDADIGTVVLRGDRLPNVAPLSFQTSVARSWDVGNGLELGLSGDLRYVGASRIGAGPLLDTRQGGYFDDHVALRLGGARAGISLEMSNLTDARRNRFALASPYRVYDLIETSQRPRMVRIGFDAAF